MKRGLKGFAFLVSGLVLGIIGLSFSLIGVLCVVCICLAATGAGGLAAFA